MPYKTLAALGKESQRTRRTMASYADSRNALFGTSKDTKPKPKPKEEL